MEDSGQNEEEANGGSFRPKQSDEDNIQLADEYYKAQMEDAGQNKEETTNGSNLTKQPKEDALKSTDKVTTLLHLFTSMSIAEHKSFTTFYRSKIQTIQIFLFKNTITALSFELQQPFIHF